MSMEDFVQSLKLQNPKIRVELDSSDEGEVWDDVMEELEENPWMAFPLEEAAAGEDLAGDVASKSEVYDSLSDLVITEDDMDRLLMRDGGRGLLFLNVSRDDVVKMLPSIPVINIPIRELTSQSLAAAVSIFSQEQGLLNPSDALIILVHSREERSGSLARQAAVRLTRVFRVMNKVKIYTQI